MRQLENCLKFFTLGLIFLLTACSSAEASRPAPVQEPPAEVKKIEAPWSDNAAAASQAQVEPISIKEKVDDAPVIAEKPVAAEEVEMANQEPEVASGDMEKAPTAEPAAVAEAMPEKAEMAVEAAPGEEESMSEQANVTQPGPTPSQLELLASLQNRGAPPELFNEVWLNSEPLKLADLHGKVVIVEFWTFGCINCKNVIPSLREWHQKYNDDGLVIIGVHTPEFSYEEDLENVKQALVDLDVPYPVAIDNDWQTWRAYDNHYWPAKYFIDKAGDIRHVHIGEGRYQQQEEIIQALLSENLS
jgi:thiol-disulfide isomerase/thioredoxin